MAGIMDKMLADGNLTRSPYMICGLYRGYYMTLQMLQGFFLRINFTLPENADINGFKNRAYGIMNQLRTTEKKISGTNVTDHTLEVMMQPASFVKNTVAMVDHVTSELMRFLAAEGAGSGCQLCGSEFSVSSYNANGSPHFLCPNCAQASLNQMEAERQSKLSENSNALTGLLGAVIGGLLGVLVWVLIYQAGYIAGIAGAAIVLFALKGYGMLGKGVDKKGVIICLVVSVIMVWIANEFSIRLVLFISAKKDGVHITFGEIMRNWSRYMKNRDFATTYYKDLVVGYFLAAIAGFGTISRAFKDATGSYTMKKM